MHIVFCWFFLIVSENCLVSHIHKRLLLCLKERRNIYWFGTKRVNKWWQNFLFWVNYPFMSSDTDLCQITALCSILQPMNHVQCHVDTWCVTPQFLGKNEQRSPPVIVYPALWNQEGHQAVTTVTLLCFDPQKRSPLLSVLLLAHFTPQYPILGLRPPSSPRAPLIVLSSEWDPDSVK